MAITRWEPFQDIEQWEPFSSEPLRELEHMQRRMNRLFERLMPTGNGGLSGLNLIPSAEMEETADEVHLKVEIPGLEAKDLNVEVTEDSVAISGERKSETKKEEKGMVRSEFRYGKFERTIPLPTHVQNDKAKAEYKNGILKLTLPKLEKNKKNVTKVKVG